jgi:hypothetical protein
MSAYMLDSGGTVTFQKADRSLAALILFSLLFTYCLFLQPVNNANVVSRAAAALSIVQDGTLSIDRFEEFTVDKAYFHDRFYCDKAPGVSLLAIPLVYATSFVLKAFGRDGPAIKDGKLTRYFTLYVYVSTVFTSGLFTAVAAAMLFLTARSLGATQVGALFGALSYGVATPAFGWATAFFGHATAGACLFLAFAAVVTLQCENPSPRHPIVLGCCVGGFLGLAMVVEFTTVPAAAAIALFALRVAVGLERDQRWRVLCSAFVSGAVMLTPLGLYNYFAFGAPMHLGYESTVGFPGIKQGLMGIGVPKLDVLGEILFGRYRGLFTVSPILFISFWSAVDIWRKGLVSSECFICIVAVATTFIMINGGFFAWDGGWSTGPRYMTPMIALLCLPLALEWSSAGPILRAILMISFMASVTVSLAATAVSMTADPDYKSPLTEFIIPKFLSGDLYASMLGTARWPGWTVMLPLTMIWVLTALIGKRLVRGGPQSPND